MTHQHNVVNVRLFLPAGPALRDVAAVVVHADDRTLVQRPEHYFCIAIVSHKWYRTQKAQKEIPQ